MNMKQIKQAGGCFGIIAFAVLLGIGFPDAKQTTPDGTAVISECSSLTACSNEKCFSVDMVRDHGELSAVADQGIPAVPPDAAARVDSSSVHNEGNAGAVPSDTAPTAPEPPEEQEEIIHQPKLILESNSLAEEKIQCGSEREFVTCFRNRSRTDAILNLSVTVRPADDSISLKTTSFYFDRVCPQEAVTISTAACVSPSAEQKKTSVEFSFSYENEKGMSYESSETAFLESFQPVQASVEGFDLASKLFSMETVSSPIQVRNIGRAPIYNAQVTVNAPGLFPVGTFFAGNLEAGASCDGSMKLYVGNKNMTSINHADADTGPDAYGSVAGTLTLSYEDAYGQTYTAAQEFTTYIQEPEVIELSVEKEPETNSWWPPILLMTVLFFSVILAVMAWRLQKSRHKLEDLLLEERSYEQS